MAEPGDGSKAELRRLFRQRRRALQPAAQGPLLALARRELPAQLPAGQWLGIYWPLAGEADLRGLDTEPQLRGRLALPRVQQGTLRYRPWGAHTALSPDDTGIDAPVDGPDLEPTQPGLLLVPALACAPAGQRPG